MSIKSYRELVVWQKAMEAVEHVYTLTLRLPREELYGLSSQMRRAAVSIPSNIAEGFQRAHSPEQAQFMRIAFGSVAELETQIELMKRLKFVTEEKTRPLESMLDEVGRMLNTIIHRLVTN